MLVYSVVLLLSSGRAMADIVFPLYSSNLSVIYDPASKKAVESNGFILLGEYDEATYSITFWSIVAAVTAVICHVVNLLLSQFMKSREDTAFASLPKNTGKSFDWKNWGRSKLPNSLQKNLRFLGFRMAMPLRSWRT